MYRFGFLLFLLSSWLIPFCVQAQVDSTQAGDTIAYRSKEWFKSEGYRINKTYLKSYITDFPKVVTAPGRYTKKDWRNVIIVSAGAGLFFAVDGPIQDIMLANQQPFWTSVSKVMEPFGNRFPPLLIGGMYLAGVITKDRKLEHVSLMTAKSLVFSVAMYTATKALVRRQRPRYTDNPYVFKAPFQGGKEYTSFPSGHANTIFSVATALAIEYKETKWVPILAYSIATLTGISRLYENRHWSSDVWLGAACGHFVTKALYKVEEEKYKKKQQLKTIGF
jgi:membrane-associated phospholipid phosphatase